MESRAKRGFLWMSVGLMSLAFWACFDSCVPPFPPATHIDKFRIIAIKAEPPEIQPGDPARFSFLAVEPAGLVSAKQTFPPTACISDAGVADPSAIWIACLPGIGAQQQSDSACTNFSFLGGGSSDGGGAPAPAPDGGSKFQILFPPCGNLSTWLSPKDYLSSLPAKEQITGAEALVVLAVVRDKQQQISLKRIRLSTQNKSLQNTNPVLTGLKVDDKDITSCRPDNREDCKVHTYKLGEPITFTATIDKSRQDPLPQEPGKPARKEDITVRWFATGGEFEFSRTVINGKPGGKDSPWPKWFANDFRGVPLKAGTEVQIIAIAQDLRGGVDWISARIKVE